MVHQTTIVAPALLDAESREKIAQNTNEDALLQLKTLAEQLIPPTTNVAFSVSQSPLQATLNTLLEEPFDNLIFTGIKGTGLLKKIFLGSMTLDVIENVKNIIVAMPKKNSIFSHEKLFVAVTETHPLNIIELNRFLNFMNKENTSITFFYLAKPNEKTQGIEKQLNDLSKLFSDKFKTSISVYEGNNPFEDIKKVINNKEEEMLIVQKGSRLLTDHLFRRFLINDLVYEGQTPLIVLP